jgi:predicted phosphodiesterase
MNLITEVVKREKPAWIIFLGDIIGVNERNIRDHQFLMRVLLFFETLNNITDGHVYTVKGNHDCGDFTDFDFLVGLGLIKNPEYLDYEGKDGVEVRFHFVNYGQEHRKLDILSNASNVVLGHADYYVEGVTTWYSAKQGIELSKLGNFCGVDLVISGHIHLPSSEILYTTLKDGKPVGLFYTGSPSRTAERIEACWYFYFEYSETENSTDFSAELMQLPSVEDTFYPPENFELDEEESEEEERSQKLTDIVKEIIDSRLTTGNIEHQIMIIPTADDDTKKLAIEYYRKAMNGE